MTWSLALVLLGALWLAWSNGANDNFKGVATLYGSGVLGYRSALWLAAIATLAGSLLSVWLANGLVQTFSGNGLLSSGAMTPAMLAAAGIGAGATVLLATWFGMPTSTTHALTGALLGAALSAHGSVNWAVLGGKFVQPLLLSPLIAIASTMVLYYALHRLRVALGLGMDSCLCVGEKREAVAGFFAPVAAVAAAPSLEVAQGRLASCSARYGGRFVGVDVDSAVNALHVLSAGSVCFARAVNDTPKIAALLLAGAVGGALDAESALVLVAAVMVLGGLIQARRVAETMSHGITALNHGQGLSANLVTAGLVLGASNFGLPVSTTHVATGSIFGIGAVNGKSDWRTIARILLTWAVTLPLGLVLGAGVFRVLVALG
ncbi:MAG: inorganic phosphate transporter family protein [Gammaproteobacteria bacterium]|nr:inorganic phosphate transporter family protein [Gammaproteobacteria bacterium]MBU1407549.1 inorganic phosphate transporter family protein [Gammaproteobacteria bacterium]MBU1531662.1 inorganic phosphate transporter family protein [Gammaproteobacteria bacterium]